MHLYRSFPVLLSSGDRPMRSTLRESVEQDADIVVFLRDETIIKMRMKRLILHQGTHVKYY